MKPEISIIVATFNRANLLRKALESVQQQTFQNWECLIIDDGSTDETQEIVLKFKADDNRFSFYVRPENLKKGPSACRNFGIELARGNFIQFFDDDDLMYPELVKEKIEALKKNKVDVVVSPHQLYNVEQKKETNVNKIFSKNLVEDYITGKLTWYCSGPMWNREFLNQFFDETLQTLEDWDYNLRCIYDNPRIHYLNKPLQRYNRYKKGITLSTKAQLGDEKQIISGFKAYKKHYLLLQDRGELSDYIKNWLYHRFVFLLREALNYKYTIANEIFDFLKKEVSGKRVFYFPRIFLGYYTYKYLGRGYKMLKVKE